MKNIRKLVVTLSIFAFAAAIQPQMVFAADFSDQFTEDFSTLQDSFSESGQRKKTIKKAPRKDKKDKKSDNSDVANVTNLDIKSDTIEYYPERQEIEAVGHASITIPEDGSTLKADKLIFNQDTGILTGYGNVRLIKDANVMEGDFVKINLNEDNALLTNAVTDNMYISLKSENANLKGHDIIMENGLAKVKEDRVVGMGNASFAQFGTSQLNEVKKTFYLKEKYDEQYTIKSKEIIIDARKEHDTVTIKNADVYLKDMKINSAGTIKLITNKEQQYVETNMPEIGFIRQIGMYAGPGVAFPAPFSGALKVVPFFNLFEGNVGVGGMARYRNDKNITEFAISSANDSKTILRGEQELFPNTKLQYGMNGYMDEWWLGDRVAGKTLELVYRKDYDVEDLGMRVAHRISGGVMQDFNSHWSTMRFRWMGQADKTLWYHGDDVKNRYATLELSTQGMGALYGTGDTMALLRFGPRLRTETDRWIQTVGYYFTAKHGDTPFVWDRYMYGTNNLYLSEGIKLNKYLSVMWSGSLALNQDAWDGKLMQENRFFVMVGPDDIKFTLGYDTVRQRTLFNCFFVVGTKNANVEYKKLYIKNPQNLGKSASEEKRKEKAAARLEAKAEMKPTLKQKLFKQYKTPDVEPEVENAIFETEPQSEINPHEYNIKYEPEPEVIVPKSQTQRKQVNMVESINPEHKGTGFFRLRDIMEQRTGAPRSLPMVEPAPIMPMQMMVDPVGGR